MLSMGNFVQMEWQAILQQAYEQHASDIHLAAGQAVFFRRQGRMQAAVLPVVPTGGLTELCQHLLSKEQLRQLQTHGDLDFSLADCSLRYRVHVYYENGQPAFALRCIPCRIPTMEEAGCAPALYTFLSAASGLVLVCGRTGAGKTTTLAAFLERINQMRPAHIITLEDPVEYVYRPLQCFISQRELGRDFLSFADGLRGALREDPDILLIGELREPEAVRIALQAAETGILVLASLHTKSAAEAALRLEGMFAAKEQEQLRLQLSMVLQGIFSQQLLPGMGEERVCAAEVLLMTPAVQHLIRAGKPAQLRSAILSGTTHGMQTMLQAAERLYHAGRITQETLARCQTEEMQVVC